MDWNLLFLVPIFIAGGVSVLTDIKYGKIKNRIMLLGFVWTGLLYTGFILYFLFFAPDMAIARYIVSEMVPNGLIALGLGYYLWQLKLWAAGDAKLFALYAFLIPLRFYSVNYIDYFPSFVLLINTFMIIVLFLLSEFLLFYAKKIKTISPKGFFKKINLRQQLAGSAKIYLNYLSVFLVLRALMQIPNQLLGQKMHLDYVLIFVILFGFRRYFINRAIRNKIIILILPFLTAGYALYLTLDHQGSYLVDSLATSFIFIVPVGLITKAFNVYLEKKGVIKTKINQLESHMVMASADVKKINKRIFAQSPKENLLLDNSGSLTTEQVKYLKEFFAQEPEMEIGVYQTLAFAPFMFSAFIITLLIKGSLISFISKLFN